MQTLFRRKVPAAPKPAKPKVSPKKKKWERNSRSAHQFISFYILNFFVFKSFSVFILRGNMTKNPVIFRDNRLPLNVIIRSTELCNFACDYCYNDEERYKEKMSSDTLENTLNFLSKFDSDIHIIWHGGEPLFMGADFYERAIEIEKDVFPKNREIKNSMQTNASLLTENNIDFFHNENFRMGLSLDGPRKINDMQRKYPDGSGTFDDVWEGISLVKDRFGYAGVISVITRNNLKKMPEIYEFFRSSGIGGMKINPFYADGRGAVNNGKLSIEPREFGIECTKVFDLWYGSQEKEIEITTFKHYINKILSPLSCSSCTFSRNCVEDFISINPRGEIYPCGRFNNEDSFILGDVRSSTPEEIFSNKTFETFKNRPYKIDKCSKCDILEYCNGGCASNAYIYEGNVFSPDHFCESYKIIFGHIKGEIEKDLKKAGALI